jgi:hypothetical protein
MFKIAYRYSRLQIAKNDESFKINKKLRAKLIKYIFLFLHARYDVEHQLCDFKAKSTRHVCNVIF